MSTGVVEFDYAVVMSQPYRFADWFQDQLDRRGWDGPEFHRRFGVARATVGAWLRGERTPFPPKSTKIIADAFGMDERMVLIAAGHMEDDGLYERLARMVMLQQTRDELRRISEEVEGGEGLPVAVTRRLTTNGIANIERTEGKPPVRILEDDLRGALSPFGLEVVGNVARDFGFHCGDVLVMDRPSGRQPSDRQIVAVRINDDAYVLRRWCLTRDGVELRDGRDNVVRRISPFDDTDIMGLYITFKPGPR